MREREIRVRERRESSDVVRARRKCIHEVRARVSVREREKTSVGQAVVFRCESTRKHGTRKECVREREKER